MQFMHVFLFWEIVSLLLFLNANVENFMCLKTTWQDVTEESSGRQTE